MQTLLFQMNCIWTNENVKVSRKQSRDIINMTTRGLRLYSCNKESKTSGVVLCGTNVSNMAVGGQCLSQVPAQCSSLWVRVQGQDPHDPENMDTLLRMLQEHDCVTTQSSFYLFILKCVPIALNV